MPRRKISTRPGSPSRRQLAILGLVVTAFALGVLTTWLALRGPGGNGEPTQIVSEPSKVPAGQLSADGALSLGNQFYDRQDWAAAIATYRQALALGFDNADVRTDLGNCYRFTGRPKEALAQYEIAQQLDPTHENSFFNAATLHAEGLGDFDQTAELLRDYLRRFPNSGNAANVRQILAGSESRSDQRDGVAEWLRSSMSNSIPPQRP